MKRADLGQKGVSNLFHTVPGVDSETQIKANIKLLISYAFVSMCVVFCNITEVYCYSQSSWSLFIVCIIHTQVEILV